ncbi:hypothetical protein SAY87_024803 [Trapa incisa]|uniref:Potassium channel tetramerisation-type BTB domain-containing protein n=1 Tax=Trapa incisa TaxID=236973 RepID=A0AAN7GA06_9MYRT|nr:hypothetical protein SAY87_024803 [Trapa incisa]
MAPPFYCSSVHAPDGSTHSNLQSTNLVAVDVGGRIFQTTRQTLSLAGPKVILSEMASVPPAPSREPSARFIDRDPELFSVVLSLLRTGGLPSKAKAFDLILRRRAPADELPLESISVGELHPRKVIGPGAERPKFAFSNRGHSRRIPPRPSGHQDLRTWAEEESPGFRWEQDVLCKEESAVH